MKEEAIRRTNTLRKPSGRKPGGQVGHEGNTLKLSDTPDSVSDVSSNKCDECGDSLEGCSMELDYTTQIVSLPELKPIVKEIRHYIKICRTCGKRVRVSSEHRRRSNAVVYDSSVKGLVVYLSIVQFLPYGRIALFFKEVFGLEISQGSMVNWVKEAKQAAAPAIEKIKEFIQSSSVVGFDESGCTAIKNLTGHGLHKRSILHWFSEPPDELPKSWKADLAIP
jgi:transposase